MANQETNSIVENLVDTQKKVVDTIVENTKKFTGSNEMLNETMQKGSDWFKNWLDAQKNFYQRSSDQATTASETVKENTNRANEFYENYMNMQMNWAKQMWDMNQDFVKSFTNNVSANPFVNWQNAWNNTNSQWNNWMTGMSPANWMTAMPGINPFNVEGWKKNNEQWSGVMSQYFSLMNNTFAEWQKNLSSGTLADSYRNMVNVGDAFNKFASIWMPMFKSIQEKSFNMDVYRQMMNPEAYKELMDKYFGFMPEANRAYVQNMMGMMNDASKQMSATGISSYRHMRGLAGNMGMDAHDVFNNMNHVYNTWHSMMNEAVAPFTRMMTPSQQTKSMAEWNDIAHRIAIYNIRNAELQYMIYTNGVKVMDALAENVNSKIQEGKEISSIIALYQEWLNISDKAYVQLFESPEYSELMAEVSSMQLRLRKDIELQMEKAFENIPVATRTEMDEVYKSIYDLKSQVRQLQSMMELENSSEESAKKA